MKTSSVKIYSLVISIFVVLLTFVALVPDKVGICPAENYNCLSFSSSMYESVEAIFIFFSALSFVFFILLFVRHEVFKTWRKFAIPYIVVALIIIAATPVYGDLAAPNREQVTWFLSGLYVVLSVIAILYRYIRLRNTA